VSIHLDKLNIEEETLKRILDFLPYPFLVSEFRQKTRYNVFVNEQFLEEIGYSCDDIPTYDDWFRVAYPDPAYRQEVKDEWVNRSLQAQKTNEDSVVLRALIRTKRNGDRWYEVKSSVSGSFYLVAFIDIHDVLARDAELQRANQNKDKILSVLGHDLRGPLRNLHSLSSLMLAGKISKEEFSTTVKDVNEKAFLSMEFLDTTLIWTKSNFDRISINVEKIKVRNLIEKILPLYKGLYDAKQITVSLNIPASISIHSDVEILTVVIRNLISNAIKFTEEKGAIKIQSEQTNGYFTIDVIDTGIGMDKDTIDNIIENHYSAARGTQEEVGLGMGLKLCKELLHHINGALEIESTLNVGTTMKIRLKNNQEDY
jgi:signal transduction histidine kinase